MRVIAGAYRGRRLEAPSWQGLRPTSDKLRETLFNVLAPRIVDARVLDACAGTGAVGIEALSRGAAHVTFVERDRRALDLIARNLGRCGIAERYAIIRADLGRPAARPLPAPFDIIFLDPPYDIDAAVVVRTVGGWLAPDGRLVLEYATRRGAPDAIDALERVRDVVSGDSALGFYRHRLQDVRGTDESS